MIAPYHLPNPNFHYWVVMGSVGNINVPGYTFEGEAVLRFYLASDHFWNQAVDIETELTWYHCTLYSQTENPFEKGDQIVVEGFPQCDPETGCPRIWTKQDGSPGAAYELFVVGYQLRSRKADIPPEDIPF